MHASKVLFLQQCVQIGFLCAKVFFHLWSRRDIVEQYVHVKAFSSFSHGIADSSGTDDSHGCVMNVSACQHGWVPADFPLSSVYVLVCFNDPSCDGHK